MTNKYAFLLLLALGACKVEKKSETTKKDSVITTKITTPTNTPPTSVPNPYENINIESKIIPSVEGTFGYDIFIAGTKTIHQPHIPGAIGHKGFATQEKAQKASEFIIYKIRNNKMPPTITTQELDSLGLLK